MTWNTLSLLKQLALVEFRWSSRWWKRAAGMSWQCCSWQVVEHRRRVMTRGSDHRRCAADAVFPAPDIALKVKKHEAIRRKNHARATGRQPPYWLTQHYLPPNAIECQSSWYLIYLLWRDGRLSWCRWLVTYGDGLPAHRRSPIQVLTGPGVE